MSSGPTSRKANRVSEAEIPNPYPVSYTRNLQRLEELIQAIREARSETDPAIRARDRRWALRLIHQEKLVNQTRNFNP